MSNLLERTNAWLGHITGAEKILLPQSVFASQSLLKMLDTDSLTENPSRAAAVGDYKAQATKASHRVPLHKACLMVCRPL